LKEGIRYRLILVEALGHLIPEQSLLVLGPGLSNKCDLGSSVHQPHLLSGAGGNSGAGESLSQAFTLLGASS
jgi:hypothetical protein